MYGIFKLSLLSSLCLSLYANADPAPANFPTLEFTDPNYTVWLWVDTQHKQLHLMDKDTLLKDFDHVAFGRGGVGYKHKRGDNVTPKGIYSVGWHNDKSSFRKFFGLTYPSIQDAEYGLQHKLINQDQFLAIVKAHEAHKVPPQNTALGGAVGIHGLGAAKRRIEKHRTSNWTEGCVALTNQQIDELAAYIKPGMPVVID